MKLDGLDHPKTLDFAARLDVCLPQAIGHLELLWAFVAQKTPHGNVGKWPDGAIARASHWSGDPTVFVTALCEAGFIEAHPDHRFIVHDWHEHAPRWVASKLSRAKESFCTTYVPEAEEPLDEGASVDEDDSTADDSGESTGDYSADYSSDSKPSLVKPSQAKPSEEKKSTGSGEPDTDDPPPPVKKSNYPDEFEQAWKAYPKRNGDNPKRSAYNAWSARVKAGATPAEILAGVIRYARWADATAKTNSEFVKRAVTFFGPDEHYLEDWSPPPATGQPTAAHAGFDKREYTEHMPDWAQEA
ncbi:hypothetical protein [Alloalcanivorax xenomutans]|uniref:hypothetical protein n=1 Tax=Alloalcanivorax xenomutans TaxID=1094342 RepID=UPI003BAB8254